MADQDYQTTLEEWLANGKQIDEYYAYLKQIVGDKLADIQDAKLKYVPAHIELPTAMYVYKPADLPNLATHLANSDYDDFSILWNEYEEYLKDIREAFSANEPQEPSFKKQSNYLKEHAAWSANQIEVEKFLADFKKALEKVQVEREKADEQYAFKAVAVEIIYDGKTFTPTNVAEFEPFVNAFTSAMPLINLKYHLDTEETSKIDAIKSQNPSDKPFFNPYRQSQETLKYDTNLTSATQFFDALKAAIAKVEQEKKEQDAQHAYTGLNEYIVVHNEAGKAYVIGAGDEDYKTLLTKLDEADEKVFAELEAWSPDTIDGLFQFAKPSENSFFYKYKAQAALDAWNKDYDAFKAFKAAFPTTLAAVKKQFLDMDKNFAYHAAPLPLEWNSKTWGITIESDIEADPKQIAALGESDIKAALSELQTYKKGKLETIAVLKPDEEDFNFKSNFKAAFAEWETDKKNHEEFFAKLEKLYNDALTYLQNPSPQVDANASPLIPQAYFHWYTGNLSGLVFCDGKHYAGKFPSVSEIQAFDESSIIYAMEELLNDAANADSAAQSYDAKPTDADYTTKHAQWLSEHNDLEAFFNAIDNALHAALQAKQSPNASPATPSVDDNLIKEAAKYGYHWCKIFFQYSSGGSPLIGTTSGVAVITWDENHFPSVADLKKEKQNTLSITQTIFFTVQKKKIEEAIKNQHNPYSSTSKEGKVFNAVQNANLTRLDAFFAKLDSLFNQAQGITSGSTSGGATTGTTSVNTSTSNGGYEWVDANFEMTEGPVSHTFELGISVVYTLMLDFSSDYLKKSAQELIKQEDLSLQAVKAKELSSNVQTDNPDAYTAAYNDNLAQITAFWKEVKAGIQTAIKIKAGESVGYKWVPVKYEFDYKGSGTIIWKEWVYPTEADLAQEPLDLLQYIDGDLSKYRDSLLDQVNAQNYANGDLAGDVIFKMARKENKERITSFFQDLMLLVAGAIDQKNGGDEDYDEIETVDDATSTSISNYTPVPIELAVEESATKQKKTFTPETGIDILFLVDKVDYTDLKDIDLEAEEGSNLFELANAEPQQQDYPEGSGYDYNASHADWEKNCETAKAFWDKAKFAIEAALKLKGVDCSTGGYKWITPLWTCNVNNKKYSDGTILPTAASFVGFTKAELDACLNDMNKTSDKLNDDVHKQTCNTKNANAVKVFNDLRLSNVVALLSFFAQVKEALESAASQYDSQSGSPKPNDTLNGASTSTVDNNAPSTPPVNDPEYQWIDIEWNFKIGKTSYKASEQHNNVINYDTLAKKCSLNVVQKLLSDFEQQRAALTENITANEPLQGAFASPVNYQKERAKWQENVNRNKAFWDKLRGGLENTVHVLNAPSCGYKWVPIIFRPSAISPYVLFDGNFTLGFLKGYAESSLNEIKNEIPAFYDAVKIDIESQKAPDSLSDDKKEQFAIVKSGNLKALDMFREKLYWAIDVLLAEMNGGAPSSEAYFVPASIQSAAVYQRVDISWTISEKDKDGNPLTLTFNSYDKISSNTLAQIPNLYLKSYLDPKSVKNVKKAGKALAKQIQSKKPIKKDFYFVADYNTAFAEWERNKEDNEVFWIVAEENLNVAFQMNVGETFKYNWIDAEWTYSGGKFRMGDGKNPTIQDFVSYSATDLQLMIDSIEPQKQALLQKVDAQKPSDVQLTSAIDIEAFEKAQKENRFRIEDFFDNILQGALEGALQKINDLLATAKPVVSASTYNASAISFNTPNNPRTVDITATSATPTFRGKTEISQLRLVWIEMTCKQLKDSERELFEKAKNSWIQYMGVNEPNTSKDTGMTFWNDGLAALDSLIQSKEALLNQSPDSPTDFPSDISSLKVIKKLGGSTGAQLVEDANGNRYVMKKGGSAGGAAGEHLKSECAADAFYRAAGVRVPDFQIYEDANGNPVKLSRYMEGMTELGSWWNNASQEEKDIMRAKLREHYAIDVLLGNWDVVGMGADNIMIDSNGEPWRIDNGGSLNYRAQGATKDTVDKSAWGEDCFIDDLWTMTGNGQRIGSSVASTIKKYYGDIDVLDIANRIMESSKNWTQNPLDYLSEADKKAVQKRLEETRQIADRGNGCIEGTFTREYTLDIIDHSYQWSKEGLREATSEKLDLENYQYGWIRGGAGSGASGADPTALKNLDIQTKIKDALITINHHNAPGNDMQPNQATVNAALALKTELQAALKAGEPGAQHYLDLLDMIETAYNNHTQTPYENGKPKIQDTSLDIYAKPKNTSGISKTDDLRSKYPGGFQAYMRAEMGDEAITFIEKCNKSQGYNSYNVDSCYTKFLRLRAQGYNLNDYSDFESFYKAIPKDEDGYYVGDPNGSREGSYSPGTHYDHFATAFQHCKNGTVDFDKRYTEMVKYNAALQIALENCEFTGNDKNTRSLVLMRTESASVVKTKTKGEKSKHTRGVNESHSLIKTVCVGGHYLTIIRVPYSRINGFYMLKNGMYLGDGENEVSADTHGLPAYYFGKVSSGRHVSEYMQEFLQMEKNNP